MRRTQQAWMASLVCATIYISGMDTWAADAEGGAGKDTLDEIVVTAQKRSESVQDVPVSVTVVSNEELSRQGVQAISDLARASASLEFTAGVPGGGGFIRGIGTEGVQSESSTGSVSVVLDGVVLGNTAISDIFDINRIEVLKGPQGTLFGTSVSAGVLSITTNAPDPSKTEGTLQVEYGNHDMGSDYSRRVLRGTANLPLTDTSALRFAFHADDYEGVYHNPTTGLSSDEPDIGARVRYLWNINDDITLNLIGDYNKDNRVGVPVLTYRDAPAGSALALSLSQCGVEAGQHNFETCSPNVDHRETLIRGVSSQLDWRLEDMTFTSITSLRKQNESTVSDFTGLPLAIAEANFAPAAPGAPGCHFFDCLPIFQLLQGLPNAPQLTGDTLFTQELRLASAQNRHFEWLAGLYYEHFSHDFSYPGATGSEFPPGGPTIQRTDFNGRIHSQDYAGFVNGTYYLTDSTRLIAGARVTHSTITESKYDPTNSMTQETYTLSTAVTKPTFRVGIQQQLAAHSMAYFTLSTGYKAPQIADDLSGGQSLRVVKPELPSVAEMGIKYSAFDDRFAIDGDVFYERVKDFQGQSCLTTSQGFICEASNVPTVDSKGIELDVFGRPLPGLSLNLTGILNPATYPAGYVGSDGTDLGGKQLNFASKVKVTLSAEQTVPLNALYSFVAGADAVYRSAQSQYLSAVPQVSAPANAEVNARFGIRSSRDWSVFVFGRNLGRTTFPRLIFQDPIQTGAYWQALDTNGLRVVGLQLEAKF